MNKEKRMQGIVETYQSSKMSLKQFAASKGISLYYLKYWVRKIKSQQATSSSYIPIAPVPTIPPDDFLEVLYPNGVKIKVGSANFSFLSQLIRVY